MSLSHGQEDSCKRWGSSDGLPRTGLRRTDKSSIAPRAPRRCSTVSDSSLFHNVFSKRDEVGPKVPSKSVPRKRFDKSLRHLELDDSITETEFADDLSITIASVNERKSSKSVSEPAMVAIACKVMDKERRYADFETGYGERRKERMRRVQRIKSNERVLPTLESQQRAIAKRRRNTGKKDGARKVEQNLQTVPDSKIRDRTVALTESFLTLCVKDQTAAFNESSSTLSIKEDRTTVFNKSSSTLSVKVRMTAFKSSSSLSVKDRMTAFNISSPSLSVKDRAAAFTANETSPS